MQWYFYYYFKALLWQVKAQKSTVNTTLHCYCWPRVRDCLYDGCITMHYCRPGQWSGPDSPDGLALMGALPVQHRLWPRPGVLHRGESVQTGQQCYILSPEQCISHIPCSSRWQICWSLEATRMLVMTRWSSTTVGLIIRGILSVTGCKAQGGQKRVRSIFVRL